MLVFVLKWLTIFVITFFYDVACTLYLKKVNEGKAFLGAMYGSIISIISAVVIIEYTNDVMFLIPSVLGGFFGTYFTIKYTRK